MGGEIFRTCPDRPWGPYSLLYNGYRIFSGRSMTLTPHALLQRCSRKCRATNLLPLWAVRPLQGLSACVQGCTLTLPFLPMLNRLTPNDPYMGRTAPLTSKLCILYIYSTSIGTEYFKHAQYSPFFSLQNAVCFIMLTCLVLVLFTVYIQDVLKLKKK